MGKSSLSISQGTVGASGTNGTNGLDAKARIRFMHALGAFDRITQTGGGSVNQGVGFSGLTQDTGITATSFAKVTALIYAGLGASLFTGNPSFDTIWTIGGTPTTGSAFCGVGDMAVTGTAITFTDNHFGFKLVFAAGVGTLYATNGDGSAETATSIQTLGVNTPVFLYAKQLDSTNIKYYVNGALVATHTTHLPTGSPTSFFLLAVSNNATANSFQTASTHMSYEKDATP